MPAVHALMHNTEPAARSEEDPSSFTLAGTSTSKRRVRAKYGNYPKWTQIWFSQVSFTLALSFRVRLVETR